MGKILVTGANGLLGNAFLASVSRSSDADVIAVWHRSSERLIHPPPKNVRYVRCDLGDRASVGELFAQRDVETVVHAAATLPDNAADFLSRATVGNVVATANLAEAAASAGCRFFVYCSSTSVYGGTCPEQGWTEDDDATPTAAYGWTKLAGEKCVYFTCRTGAMHGVALRLSGIHGPGRYSGVLAQLIRAAQANNPICLDNGTVPFQLVFVVDAVNALLSAMRMETQEPFESINVASHTFSDLRTLATLVIRACHSTSDVSSDHQPQGRHVMNTDRMISRLGLTLSDPEQHLQRTIKWYAGLSF